MRSLFSRESADNHALCLGTGDGVSVVGGFCQTQLGMRSLATAGCSKVLIPATRGFATNHNSERCR
jgi:hypothetical protein